MAFHPKGNQRFMEGVISDLELKGTYLENSLKYLGKLADIAKYSLLIVIAGKFIYYAVK